MEVKPGYKQTEIGLIPEEWEVIPLSRTAHRISRGASPRPIDSPAWFNDNSNVGWVRISDVTRSVRYLFETTQRLSDAGIRKSRYVPAGSLIMSICATVGRPIETRIDACIHDGFVVFDEPTIDQGFLYHVLTSLEPTWSQRGQTGSQMNLNTGLINNCLIAIPSDPEEQCTIAETLSDMDALLGGLDRLIAKKRDLKQAAMQQLLTGQTRLPGFHDEWEVKRLGDHVAFLRNGVNSRAELLPEGRVKYLHYGDIHASKETYLSPESLPAIPDTKATRLDRLQDGDLVFADASEDLVGVSKSVEMKGIGTTEVVPGQHTIAARFDKTVLADGFKGFLQFCPQFASHLRRLAAGTKVYATNRAYISSVEMLLPSVPEQSAIAAVLLDMDAELALLEARLVKTRNLKQAMMQELLTGNIRLLQPAIATESPALSGTHANIYFKRSVLAAEIISQLHDEPTFGHVKLEKMLFLVEHLCEVDTGSTYRRQAAGPYDNRALRSIDSQIKKQKWFEAQRQDTRYRYVPLEKAGDHAQYFERYYSSIRVKFDGIIAKFRTFNTERCEIVATLYSAWDDLIQQGKSVSDDAILIEVLERWHESKQRIPRDRWLKALDWMRDNHLVPPGCYHAE